MEKKRKNFSDLEAEVFLFLLNRFKSDIQKKKTDSITNKEKAKAWAELTAMYNKFPGVVKRSSQQLINFYKNHRKRKGIKNQSNSSVEIVNTEGSPKVSTSTNPVVERLSVKGSLKPTLVDSCDSDASNDEMSTFDTTHCENSFDQEETHEITDVRCVAEDIVKCHHDIKPSTHSEEVPVTLIPEMSNQDIFIPSFQSQGSLQTVSNPDIKSSNTLHNFNSLYKKCYDLRQAKRKLSTSSKAADSVIQQSELKKKYIKEQHEWEREKFNLEKEKISMQKEKHLLEMRLLKEQVKMYELMNEKIAQEEGIQICV